MGFNIDDRVVHKDDHSLIGIIVQMHEDSQSCLVEVYWDETEDPFRWYSASYLRLHDSIRVTPSPRKVQEPIMSQAIWCDKGGHAFSSKDPDKEHYTSTRSVPNGNVVQQVTAELDICGPCTKDVVLFEAPQITTGTQVQDKVPTQVQQ